MPREPCENIKRRKLRAQRAEERSGIYRSHVEELLRQSEMVLVADTLTRSRGGCWCWCWMNRCRNDSERDGNHSAGIPRHHDWNSWRHDLDPSAIVRDDAVLV